MFSKTKDILVASSYLSKIWSFESRSLMNKLRIGVLNSEMGVCRKRGLPNLSVHMWEIYINMQIEGEIHSLFQCLPMMGTQNWPIATSICCWLLVKQYAVGRLVWIRSDELSKPYFFKKLMMGSSCNVCVIYGTAIPGQAYVWDSVLCTFTCFLRDLEWLWPRILNG